MRLLSIKSVIVIFIIAITLAGCTSTSRSDAHYNGNSMHNIKTTGKILELEDGSIYFTNNEEQIVYLYHVDENLNLISKQELELKDGSVGLNYLNIVDNMLYGFDEDKNQFVRIKLDKSRDLLKTKKVLEFDSDPNKQAVFIIISNDRIYRICSLNEGYMEELSSFDLNGKNELYHGSFFSGSFVSNGDIYRVGAGEMYINDEQLFKLGELEYLKYCPHKPVYYNNYIYTYAVGEENEYMIRFKADSGTDPLINMEDIEVIFNEKAIPINFYDDKMVFLGDGKTYISNLDGTEKIAIFDNYVSAMMTRKYIFIETKFGKEVYDYAGNQVKLF